MAEAQALEARFREVRRASEALASPLSEADAQLQSMPDASPAKWHLAHTSWFFESFLLPAANPAYQPFRPEFFYLFNSYYNGLGEQYPRHQRGLISRPSLAEVLEYRRYVSEQMLVQIAAGLDEELQFILELGLNHEQQHQELLLTDIKHAFFQNPCFPAYQTGQLVTQALPELTWMACTEGLYEIGAKPGAFCFDNEAPAHQYYLPAFQLASRVISNGEYAAFIEEGGYRNPLLWLADGWAELQISGREHPYFWRRGDDGWQEFTLYGMQPLLADAPACHLSYFEANAFATWAGKRLPREAEWEAVARKNQLKVAPEPVLHPHYTDAVGMQAGAVWERTQSAYQAYPGFHPFVGMAGEYNGKFMSGQYVLRGSSAVTSAGHSRLSYRNFFYPHQQWQFSGIRLAADAT